MACLEVDDTSAMLATESDGSGSPMVIVTASPVCVYDTARYLPIRYDPSFLFSATVSPRLALKVDAPDVSNNAGFLSVTSTRWMPLGLPLYVPSSVCWYNTAVAESKIHGA